MDVNACLFLTFDAFFAFDELLAVLHRENILDEGGQGVVELVAGHALVRWYVQRADKVIHIPNNRSP